ncbi:MAG: dCTP deaminase [Nanoarchaeota archaeon]|nr:dCTP deaminase [Nanoarchaeota archaeon]MBU1643974.1 dCTP deaminase [Nanoarchaeota archaeon]MBU1977140.1 dCTP deaminase [Nanoarchaeota archaeon]
MSILTKNEIFKEIKKGNIKIMPFDRSAVGPGSVDLTLDNQFRIFIKGKTLDVNENSDYQKISRLIKKDSIVLKPGELIMAITKEKITLSENLCGWLEGRSRFARLGLLVHITAGFMQPGIDNQQVLEIANLSQRPLRLHAGIKICQFIFQKTKGKAKYEGRFVKQKEV